jgi:hypothetical protein
MDSFAADLPLRSGHDVVGAALRGRPRFLYRGQAWEPAPTMMSNPVNRNIVRIVTVLLIPGLLADSLSALPISSPRPLAGEGRVRGGIFTEQALAVRFLAERLTPARHQRSSLMRQETILSRREFLGKGAAAVGAVVALAAPAFSGSTPRPIEQSRNEEFQSLTLLNSKFLGAAAFEIEIRSQDLSRITQVEIGLQYRLTAPPPAMLYFVISSAPGGWRATRVIRVDPDKEIASPSESTEILPDPSGGALVIRIQASAIDRETFGAPKAVSVKAVFVKDQASPEKKAPCEIIVRPVNREKTSAPPVGLENEPPAKLTMGWLLSKMPKENQGQAIVELPNSLTEVSDHLPDWIYRRIGRHFWQGKDGKVKSAGAPEKDATAIRDPSDFRRVAPLEIRGAGTKRSNGQESMEEARLKVLGLLDGIRSRRRIDELLYDALRIPQRQDPLQDNAVEEIVAAYRHSREFVIGLGLKERDLVSALKLFDRAFALSVTLHAGQRRHSGLPYLIHPARAAELWMANLRISKGLSTPWEVVEDLAAVWLHDAIEDSAKGRWGWRALDRLRRQHRGGKPRLREMTGMLIEELTNREVRETVESLTKPLRAGRDINEKTWETLAQLSARRQRIKLADWLSNLLELEGHSDPVKFMNDRLGPVLRFAARTALNSTAKYWLLDSIGKSLAHSPMFQGVWRQSPANQQLEKVFPAAKAEYAQGIRAAIVEVGRYMEIHYDPFMGHGKQYLGLLSLKPDDKDEAPRDLGEALDLIRMTAIEFDTGSEDTLRSALRELVQVYGEILASKTQASDITPSDFERWYGTLLTFYRDLEQGRVLLRRGWKVKNRYLKNVKSLLGRISGQVHRAILKVESSPLNSQGDSQFVGRRRRIRRLGRPTLNEENDIGLLLLEAIKRRKPFKEVVSHASLARDIRYSASGVSRTLAKRLDLREAVDQAALESRDAKIFESIEHFVKAYGKSFPSRLTPLTIISTHAGMAPKTVLERAVASPAVRKALRKAGVELPSDAGSAAGSLGAGLRGSLRMGEKIFSAAKRFLDIHKIDIEEWAMAQQMLRTRSDDDKLLGLLDRIGLFDGTILQDFLLVDPPPGFALTRRDPHFLAIIETRQGLKIVMPKYRLDLDRFGDRESLGDVVHEIVELRLLQGGIQERIAHLRAKRARQLFIRDGRFDFDALAKTRIPEPDEIQGITAVHYVLRAVAELVRDGADYSCVPNFEELLERLIQAVEGHYSAPLGAWVHRWHRFHAGYPRGPLAKEELPILLDFALNLTEALVKWTQTKRLLAHLSSEFGVPVIDLESIGEEKLSVPPRLPFERTDREMEKPSDKLIGGNRADGPVPILRRSA